MSTQEQTMSTQEQQLDTQEFTLEKLRERLDVGLKKSVDAIVKDIVKEYVARLDNGNQEFKYIRDHFDPGYFMSPVYTRNDTMKWSSTESGVGYDNILHPKEDIDKFTELIFNKLKKNGILVKKSTVEYKGNSYGWYHMCFELTLTLADT